MKAIVPVALALAMTWMPSDPHALDIWPGDLVFGNQGGSATIRGDTRGGPEPRDLAITVSVLDGSGKPMHGETRSAPALGSSAIDQRGPFFLEGVERCDDGLSRRVDPASASLDGAGVGLIATDGRQAYSFKPWPIRIK